MYRVMQDWEHQYQYGDPNVVPGEGTGAKSAVPSPGAIGSFARTGAPPDVCRFILLGNLDVCIHVFICICIYIYVSIFVYLYIYLCMYIYRDV